MRALRAWQFNVCECVSFYNIIIVVSCFCWIRPNGLSLGTFRNLNRLNIFQTDWIITMANLQIFINNKHWCTQRLSAVIIITSLTIIALCIILYVWCVCVCMSSIHKTFKLSYLHWILYLSRRCLSIDCTFPFFHQKKCPTTIFSPRQYDTKMRIIHENKWLKEKYTHTHTFHRQKKRENWMWTTTEKKWSERDNDYGWIWIVCLFVRLSSLKLCMGIKVTKLPKLWIYHISASLH